MTSIPLPLVQELIEEVTGEPTVVERSRGTIPIVRAGDRRFLVEMKGDSRSASVAAGIRRLRMQSESVAEKHEADVIPILVVRHMGSAGAELCRRYGTNWIDFDGNADIRAGNLLIRVAGRLARHAAITTQEVNPFAPKASRVVHALLLEPRRPWTVTALQSETNLDKGSISRTVTALQEAKYVSRNRNRRSVIEVNDPRTLFEAWGEHYKSRAVVTFGLLATRDGLQTRDRVCDILKAHGVGAIIGGLPAAAAYTNFGSFRRVRVYVAAELNREIRSELNVSSDPRGRNVLAVVDDGRARIGSETIVGRRYTSPILTYLDLGEEPERAQEAREDLRKVIEGRWT